MVFLVKIKINSQHGRNRRLKDRKSTRLNSSHVRISYAVFCLKKKMETNNLFNNLIQRNQSASFSSGTVRPNHETNINIIARRTGKDVNSHTVLDGIITTIMATILRINIIGSREFFFFNDTATTEIYTLSLHDALPI